MGQQESIDKKDMMLEKGTCDEKMIYCRESNNFNPKEWDSLNKKCQNGDEDSCAYLRSKYDGEYGIFASYQNCLQNIGGCQESQPLQQEYRQLSESPSVMPFVGGMIMGGLMGSMMQSAFQNRQNQMASQGFRTPYNQPGGGRPGGSPIMGQQSPPKHTGTTDLSRQQGANMQKSTPTQNLGGGGAGAGAGAAANQQPQPKKGVGQGFGRNTQGSGGAPAGKQQFGRGFGSPSRQRGWSSSGGRGFGARGGFGRRR